MVLDLRGQANGRVWADLLRERPHTNNGRARPVRPHDDRAGTSSLLA